MTDATALAQKAAAEIKTRIAQLDPLGLDLWFQEARSHNAWQDRPAGDDPLRALYEVAKMGPATVNSSPARFLFLILGSSLAARALFLPFALLRG